MEDGSSTSTRVPSLSDFPVHLLLHILSFLSTIDAIQTSLVCRKWRHIWSSLPFLHFSHALFPPSDSLSETRRSFAEFVDRTLILRSHSPILKLRLQFDFAEERYASHVNSWVRYAIAHHAFDLNLDFFKGWDFDDYDFYNDGNEHDDNQNENGSYYSFPFYVLRNGCVGVLKLCYCTLSLPSTVSDTRFFSLSSLSLNKVFLTDQMVSDILVRCVNLEDLALDYAYGLKDVKIASTKLRKLLLKSFDCNEGSAEIDTPNLYSLSIICFDVGNYVFRNVASLVEADVVFPYYSSWRKVVSLLGHVQRLSVINSWFEFLASKDVLSENFALHNLNLLNLRTGYSKSDILGIAALLERSPNLGTMILDYVYVRGLEESSSEEFLNEPINFSLPRLKQIKIKNFKGTEGELQFIMLLEKHGVVLEKIVLVPSKVGEILLDGLKELKFSKDLIQIQKF